VDGRKIWGVGELYRDGNSVRGWCGGAGKDVVWVIDWFFSRQNLVREILIEINHLLSRDIEKCIKGLNSWMKRRVSVALDVISANNGIEVCMHHGLSPDRHANPRQLPTKLNTLRRVCHLIYHISSNSNTNRITLFATAKREDFIFRHIQGWQTEIPITQPTNRERSVIRQKIAGRARVHDFQW
jgi:hypothetical protein